MADEIRRDGVDKQMKGLGNRSKGRARNIAGGFDRRHQRADQGQGPGSQRQSPAKIGEAQEDADRDSADDESDLADRSAMMSFSKYERRIDAGADHTVRPRVVRLVIDSSSSRSSARSSNDQRFLIDDSRCAHGRAIGAQSGGDSVWPSGSVRRAARPCHRGGAPCSESYSSRERDGSGAPAARR